MIQTLIILWMMLIGPMALFFIYRVRVAGRILCIILEEDKSVRNRLVKVEGNYLTIGDSRYLVDPDTVRLMRYPSGWPVWLQQIVPTCLYRSDEAHPLDWNTQAPVQDSASALAAVMEPEWLKLIVRGTREGAESVGGSGSRIITILGIGVSVVTLVMMFYVISRLAAVETLVRGVSG